MKLSTKLWVDYYIGGIAHALLKPPTILLGKILRRDHRLTQSKSLTVIKMLGGGSLVIAYPSLLALKNAPGIGHLRLLTTPAVVPFARLLGVFDEILVLREDSILHLLFDSASALRKLFLSDSILDLEVHSRLTTVFCLLTCARNRIGFYTNQSFWRKGLSTHLLFFNVFRGVYNFYEQAARLFGVSIPAPAVYRASFRAHNALPAISNGTQSARRHIAVAPCCSDLTRERMLAPEDWPKVLTGGSGMDRDANSETELHLLGGAADGPALDHLSVLLEPAFGNIVNHAGKLSLEGSVRLLASMDALYCIDSAMLHFARLLGVKTVSFWGPTSPESRLKILDSDPDEIRRGDLPCSPCVHVAQEPPCHGNNLCMLLAVDPERRYDPNPPWLVWGPPKSD